MNWVTNLHGGVLCDQDQALNALGCLHRHHRGNLSSKTVAKDMGLFNLQSIHGAQYSLGNLSPISQTHALERTCVNYQVKVIRFGVKWGFCAAVVVMVDGDDVIRFGQPPITKLGGEKVGIEETRMEHDDSWA